MPYALPKRPVLFHPSIGAATSVSCPNRLQSLETFTRSPLMPVWSNDIPEDPRGYALPLLRCPAAVDFESVVTSENLIGTNTHFWGGHTVPCTGHDCEPCQAGSEFRWHAYQSAYNPKDQLHFIFECTAHAAKPFGKYRKEHGTLRGCQFRAYRWKRRKNGRVIIRCTPSQLNVAASKTFCL